MKKTSEGIVTPTPKRITPKNLMQLKKGSRSVDKACSLLSESSISLALPAKGKAK